MRRGAGSRSALLTAVTLLPLIGGSCGPPPDTVRPLPDGTTSVVRNHREVVPGGDGLIPRFLGGRDAGICLEVPSGVDASQWRASMFFRRHGPRGRPAESREPVARSDRVVCFDHPWPQGLETAAELDLCGSVTDLYDGAVFELPCRRVRFEPDPGGRAARMQEINVAVGRRHDGSPDTLADRLMAVGRKARGEGFPALSLRARLIAVHYLLQEGDASQVRRADRLLGSLPPWLDDPAATGLAADATYLRGVLHLRRLERLEDAWQSFLEAQILYRRLLDKKRLAAVRGQAEVLARVGAVREALRRLDAALATCGEQAPCSSLQRLDARGLHAWLTLVDSHASPEELGAAAESLEEVQGETGLEPRERANHLINLALLRARQGREPSVALTEARRLMAPADGSRRANLLRGWSRMAEAVYELSRSDGDLPRAEDRCRKLVSEGASDRLRAWAFSCLGRVHRRQGRSAQALQDFQNALTLHEDATPERLGRLLPLGPGQRADDHYRAARVALDLGDPDRAWEILTRLDHLPPGGDPDSPAEEPRPGETTLDRGYRAFALDDEILLLRRDADDRVILVRRTSLAGGELRRRTEAVDRALDERGLSDEAWRELLQPLAGALTPPPGESSDPVTPYALHGLLQRVPLAALPARNDRADDGADDDGVPRDGSRGAWLADATTLAIRPAGAGVLSPPEADPASVPLIVLDPTENLGGRRKLASFYSRRFPEGRLLAGPEATEAAFWRALPSTSWLHADTHGSYDPAFPERSSLKLADGAVTLRELVARPPSLDFAHLSGCRTGSWPVTADSGRYGIGGLLARQGVPWVIASRGDLLNELAVTFNPVFYQALTAGAQVPAAYAAALARVRERFPAVAWASMFLIRGAVPGDGDSQRHSIRGAPEGARATLAHSLPRGRAGHANRVQHATWRAGIGRLEGGGGRRAHPHHEVIHEPE